MTGPMDRAAAEGHDVEPSTSRLAPADRAQSTCSVIPSTTSAARLPGILLPNALRRPAASLPMAASRSRAPSPRPDPPA
jgi:hypothetical protein